MNLSEAPDGYFKLNGNIGRKFTEDGLAVAVFFLFPVNTSQICDDAKNLECESISFEEALTFIIKKLSEENSEIAPIDSETVEFREIGPNSYFIDQEGNVGSRVAPLIGALFHPTKTYSIIELTTKVFRATLPQMILKLVETHGSTL
jgi:hypothetical protein